MQFNRTMLWLMIPFLSVFSACPQDKTTTMHFESPGYIFPYQLAKPDQSWRLPSTLLEISGISLIDEQRLACIQDELGIIYIFNLQSGKVETEINFGEPGDYEAVEIVGNDAWVLKKNGTLYQVTGFLDKAESHVKKYPTALSGKNDTEGLAYDPVNKHLLIACKEDPFVDEKEGSGYKAIYRFDLETNIIDAEPHLLISLDSINKHKGDAAFKPSGIAIHPLTGNIFILAAVGKLMVVLSGKGEMLAMAHLNPMIFRQPEGICFSPEGTLYIASEGDGREGMLLKFEPRK